MTDAMLYARLDPGPDDARDFYAWYEDTVVPGRMGVPGFRRARRFRARDRGSLGLMVYDVDDLEVLSGPDYRALQAATATVTSERLGALESFERATGTVVHTQGEVGDGTHLFVVGFAVPDDAVDELDRWYAEEHGPMLLEAPGWDGFRVLDVTESNTGLRRIALHELSDLAALDAPERAAAGSTEWRARLAEEPWFAGSQRCVYDAVSTFRLEADTS
jgi:hypothetical protein